MNLSETDAHVERARAAPPLEVQIEYLMQITPSKDKSENHCIDVDALMTVAGREIKGLISNDLDRVYGKRPHAEV